MGLRLRLKDNSELVGVYIYTEDGVFWTESRGRGSGGVVLCGVADLLWLGYWLCRVNCRNAGFIVGIAVHSHSYYLWSSSAVQSNKTVIINTRVINVQKVILWSYVSA